MLDTIYKTEISEQLEIDDVENVDYITFTPNNVIPAFRFDSFSSRNFFEFC